MSKKAIVFGLFVALLASPVVGIAGASADYNPVYGGLSCTPATQSVASGDLASFTAYQDYLTNVYPQPQLTWTATNGTPSYGYGQTFSSRFYTADYSATYTVSVTNGYQTAYCSVYVSRSYPTPTPTTQVYLSPQSPSANSGDNVTFTAWGGNGTYSWTSTDGTPVSGWGSTFTTRFYNYTGATQYHQVVVTSGGSTARTWVSVSPVSYTPTPTPYQSLQCSPSYTTANSGDVVYLNTWGGNGTYSWSAPDGNPTYGYGSSFQTRFYNYMSYAQNRTVTVTSGGQTAICTVLVNGSNTYPTPTPTVYPYPDARVELRMLGRDVTRGQSGEYTSVRAQSNDTLDLIIRIRSTNGSYLYNAYVTDLLPAGLSYIPGTTTVNGYVVADGITSSGINVGTLNPNSETAVKLSVRVDGAYVPVWGTITVNTTAQVRADGLSAMSAQLPITLGQNLNITTVSAVKTGPADSLWLALLVSAVITAAYAAYTRTDLFGRRMALAEVNRLSRSNGLNFSK
jgi:uncharacterized repeat protein (TIGR01451 family)